MSANHTAAYPAAQAEKRSRSEHEQDNFDLVTRSLESIHREIELGTDIDLEVVKDIEERLAHYDDNIQ